MVDVDVAVGHIVHEKRPEEISCYNWVRHVLAPLDDAEKRLKGITIARPIVFSNQIDLVDRTHQSDIVLKLGVLWWVIMVRKYVDRVNIEVSLVDAVRAIDHELFRSKFLDERLRLLEDNHGDLAEQVDQPKFPKSTPQAHPDPRRLGPRAHCQFRTRRLSDHPHMSIQYVG